jgi:hypothetical protein
MPLYPVSTPGSGTTTTATSGGPASTATTQIGGVNGGNLINLAVDATGRTLVDLFDGAGTAVLVGQTTMASSLPVVIASNQTAVPVSGTFWQATQPVSGTVTANAGTGNFTVVQATGTNLHAVIDSGTVTANIGTTNGLALDATLAKLTIAQGAALGSNTQALIGGSVTTAAPTYTTGQISPLSLTTAGEVRVAITSNSVDADALAQGSTTSGQNGSLIMGAVTTASPAYTTAQTSPLSLTTAGALRTDSSATTQPVSGTVTANAGTGNFTVVQATGTNLHAVIDSGTVTANIGTTNGLALDATLAKLTVAQGTALGANTQAMVGGSVTTAAPAYTTGQISPLSLTTAGSLRTDNSSWFGSTAPTVGSKTSANSIPVVVASDQGAIPVSQSGTWTVQPGNTANTTAWLVTGTGGTFPITAASLPLPTGAATSANQTTLGNQTTKINDGTNTAAVKAASTAAAATDPALVVSISPNSPATVSQATAANLNAQVVGNAASASADSGNPVKIGLVAATALPTAATNTQRMNAMGDKFGRLAAVLGTVRDLKGTQTTTISASTTETTIVTAGGAGVFNDPVMILVANTSAGTNTRIDFRDATAGTVRFSMQCPANQTTGFNIPGESIPQTTAANNWTAQCATSTTDVRIYVLYEKNG